jgi:Peptidase MA superfamily
VFADATDNPYRQPPRWLNEGLAVYLAEGYGVGDRAQVADAAASGVLTPLSAIAGLFPTTYDSFSLAYAQSVSAVDFFIDTYGQDALVALIGTYRDGVTDDEAFEAATGADFRAFDDAWLAAQGVSRPEPYGPQPAPRAPQPSAWASDERAADGTSAP